MKCPRCNGPTYETLLRGRECVDACDRKTLAPEDARIRFAGKPLVPFAAESVAIKHLHCNTLIKPPCNHPNDRISYVNASRGLITIQVVGGQMCYRHWPSNTFAVLAIDPGSVWEFSKVVPVDNLTWFVCKVAP